MKKHRYRPAAKITAICMQQLFAVTFIVFFVLVGSLFRRSMLEFGDTSKIKFEDSAYFASEFRMASTEIQKLISLRKRFETDGRYDPSKEITIAKTKNEEVKFLLGNLENWAKEGYTYENTGSLDLVKEDYPQVGGGSFLDDYHDHKIGAQEASNISNALENTLSTLEEDIGVYIRLLNKYSPEMSNVLYYYADMDRNKIHNLDVSAKDENAQVTKEWAREKIEGLGAYLSYDDQQIRFATNVDGLEEYFYRDVNYITGSMDSNAVFMMGVDTSLPHMDSFYDAKASYGELRPWIKISFAAAIISLIGWIAMLVYLSTVTGRNAHEEEVSLGWFDRIWTEVYFALVFASIFLMVFLVDTVLTREWEIQDFLIMSGLLAFLGNAAFLILYLSLIRRIHADALWHASLCCQFLRATQGIYRNWKVTGRFAFIFVSQALATLILAGCAYSYDNPYFFIPLAILLFIEGIWMLRDMAQRQKIMDGIRQIQEGNLEYKINMEDFKGENLSLGEGINNLGNGLEKAVETSMRNERMKADLITNVSHDIKTPLTSIINYVDLLDGEQIENETARGYVKILQEKAARLKQLTEDLVEASKISSGNITLEMTRINFVELVRQAGGEFNERFETQELTVITKLPNEPVTLIADGRKLWRVLENLYQNVAKYALKGTRVYVELEKREEAKEVLFSIKNISEQLLHVPSEDLTERFIRGDVSRTTEGSGLGLSIAQNLVNLMGGNMAVTLDGDLFKVTLRFPLAF